MTPSFTYETIHEAYPPVLCIESEMSRCKIALHGGHVLSFVPAGSDDLLWVSEKAVYREGKAIRGGIPVCWPWFGAHPDDPLKPSHGIARVSVWEIAETGMEEGMPFARLILESEQTDREHFDYDYTLELKVVAGETLRLFLTTHNRDARPFPITEALHSYFAVSDIREVRVKGMDGRPYIDQLQQNQTFLQHGAITFGEEVDRIYRTDRPCRIDSPAGTYSLHSSGSRSSVVWNPWIDKAGRLSDFGDEEYREMVCVETANVGPDTVVVSPGACHTLAMKLEKH